MDYKSRFIDMSIPYAAGSMYSTVEDMLKWDQALYNEKLISDKSKERMFTPFLREFGFGSEISDVMVGDLRKKLVTHGGTMFSSTI